MKRFFLTFSLAFALATGAFSQAVEQGKMIVDASYGWPNLWTSTLKNILTDNNSYNIKVGTLGPIGAKFEYMVADKVGVGIVFNYATSSVKWNDTSYVSGVSHTYDYKVSIPRYRIMAKFGFHYGNSDMFDGYTNICVGYGGFSWVQKTDDPNFKDDNYNLKLTPIAFRICTGGRIFFTDNIGAMMEFGIGGGGLMEFGLCAKF
jgi:opacity protein-like surface antigen